MDKYINEAKKLSQMESKGKDICFIRTDAIDITVAFNKFLYEYFAKTFERIYFLDASRVFTTKIKYNKLDNKKYHSMLPDNFEIITPSSLSEFKNFLKSSDIIVLSAFSEEWYDWYIAYYLRKYSIPLVYIYNISLLGSYSYKKLPLFRFLEKFKWRYLSNRIYTALVFMDMLAKVDTFFVSQKIDEGALKKFRGYQDVVVTNSKVYDIFLENKFKISEDYIIFLDSMPIDHGDQLRYGHKTIDRNLYYTSLGKVLRVIESIVGKEAIVCLHPRYDESNVKRDFNGRKTFKHRTDEFIAKAALVLFHDSSAVNGAILNNKKIVQLTGSRFNDFVKGKCMPFQEMFAFKTIDIYNYQESEIKEIVSNISAAKEKYEAFLLNYIIASGQQGISSSKQIADYISHKYGVLQKIRQF